MDDLDIYHLGHSLRGWGPIETMTALACEQLSANRITLPRREHYGVTHSLRAALPIPRRRTGARHALLIAGVPGELRGLLEQPLWTTKYESVSAWVIDSFWPERVPRVIQNSKRLDTIWVADANDVSDWDKMFPGRVHVLPWGADCLAAHEAAEVDKETDLLRVGRQPAAFDDDDATQRAARGLGLQFSGRPPFGDSVQESETKLQVALSRAKSVLAFSNLVDGSTYTHPTKEYITGRWTGALAHGAAVAGRCPATPTASELVPSFARIDIPHDDLDAALIQVKDWVDAWTPDLADRIRYHALALVDWRHRFEIIRRTLGLTAPRLADDLATIENLISGPAGQQIP